MEECLINLFFNSKSLNFFTRPMFSKISSCTTQDEISKNRFKKLGVKNVDCSSNIKFLSNKLSFEKKDHLSFKKN